MVVCNIIICMGDLLFQTGEAIDLSKMSDTSKASVIGQGGRRHLLVRMRRRVTED